MNYVGYAMLHIFYVKLSLHSAHLIHFFGQNLLPRSKLTGIGSLEIALTSIYRDSLS